MSSDGVDKRNVLSSGQVPFFLKSQLSQKQSAEHMRRRVSMYCLASMVFLAHLLCIILFFFFKFVRCGNILAISRKDLVIPVMPAI
nr:MAG TPA: hypothetical protein [Caudoviricetes sp.]